MIPRPRSVRLVKTTPQEDRFLPQEESLEIFFGVYTCLAVELIPLQHDPYKLLLAVKETNQTFQQHTVKIENCYSNLTNDPMCKSVMEKD